ncbi:MAG TPA: FKBP-type peptidyl-prolyl cis-trans isomerase [Crocinitomicaceae bacterium]|nr:FKBP-type peptidyl-prolyl cis-trans isomerase [Crocinitomicaceae bacterium]
MNFWIKNSIIILLFFLVACKPKAEKEITWNKEMSTNLGKEIAQEEDIDIELFIDQHPNLKFEATGTGLRIAFLKKGDGEKAETGKIAEVNFKISLLDGTVCYQSDLDRADYYKIDKEDIESGVQEGIKLMNVGDKCKLIVPSHLAHGLVGDMDKIPPLSVLVIDLELISIK